MSKRAERRHNKRRIWKKLYNRRKCFGESYAINYANRGLRTPCSCSVCGNPRKYFNELTIQEKRNI